MAGGRCATRTSSTLTSNNDDDDDHLQKQLSFRLTAATDLEPFPCMRFDCLPCDAIGLQRRPLTRCQGAAPRSLKADDQYDEDMLCPSIGIRP